MANIALLTLLVGLVVITALPAASASWFRKLCTLPYLRNITCYQGEGPEQDIRNTVVICDRYKVQLMQQRIRRYVEFSYARNARPRSMFQCAVLEAIWYDQNLKNKEHNKTSNYMYIAGCIGRGIPVLTRSSVSKTLQSKRDVNFIAYCGVDQCNVPRVEDSPITRKRKLFDWPEPELPTVIRKIVHPIVPYI